MHVQKGFSMKPTTILPILALVFLSCSGNMEQNGALVARDTAEKVKEKWSKVEKPLTITVIGRDKDELEDIGSIGVFLSDNPSETAREFRFDGESFKPVNAVNVDSTCRLPRKSDCLKVNKKY